MPAVKNTAWALSPIDHFILQKLEARGFRPTRPPTSAPSSAGPPTTSPVCRRPQRTWRPSSTTPPRPPSSRPLTSSSLRALASGTGAALARRRALTPTPPAATPTSRPVPLQVPQLRHRLLQRRQALRPLRQGAARRRPVARPRRETGARQSHRHRLPRPVPPVRLAQREPPDGRRLDRQHRQGVPRPERQLRPAVTTTSSTPSTAATTTPSTASSRARRTPSPARRYTGTPRTSSPSAPTRT